MPKELKVKIVDFQRIERRLLALGATFEGEHRVTDTYFKQPAGNALKVSEDESCKCLLELCAKDGVFEIVRRENISDPVQQKSALHNQYGISCVITKRRRLFKYKDAKININLIDDLGEFLILEAENPDRKIIERDLRLGEPEYISESFDELVRRKS